MYIHEAISHLAEKQKCSASRKKWLEKGAISKRIALGHNRTDLVMIYRVDEETAANPWVPTAEDITADDWFYMTAIIRNGKKIGVSPKGIL